VGAVTVEIHRVVVDSRAILTRSTPGYTGDEVIADYVIDEAISFVVDPLPGFRMII
jgi:hypothetical protein